MEKIDREILSLERHVKTLLLLEERRMEEERSGEGLPPVLQDAVDMAALVMTETGIRFCEERAFSALRFLADPDTGCREDLYVAVSQHGIAGAFVSNISRKDELIGILNGIKERKGEQAWLDMLERNLLRNIRDWLLDRLCCASGLSEDGLDGEEEEEEDE